MVVSPLGQATPKETAPRVGAVPFGATVKWPCMPAWRELLGRELRRDLRDVFPLKACTREFVFAGLT